MYVCNREKVTMHDPKNTLFTLAADFIQYTNRSVFLTGKAGTGKTTFLKYIRQNTTKQTAVVAPTGVAAINAGGVTINSFFQLPFTPFIPASRGFQQNGDAVTDKHSLISRLKINNERRKVLQQLELLVIDEISMVRCDVLDAIDAVLRHFRSRHHEPFGGVQVLFIGDMFQLPPVARNEEWQILSQFYKSPYFFDSKVIEQQEPVHIEMTKIYRQTDQYFIDLLNMVRNNEMDEDGFNRLHKHYNPAFQPVKNDGYIILTTHNNKADTINNEELAKLTDKPVSYKAKISGEFYEKSFPADEVLQLKKGAQVMFVKNDKDKRYYNGKIGTITQLTNEMIHVQCKDEPAPIEVRIEKWENIRYTLNQTTQQVEEEEAGTFEQFPLRLAWAITIHKSQGLTFEKAIIDAGAAFAPGQVYVALSRCTSLQGIVLKSRITQSGLISDPHILQFAQQKNSANHLTGALYESKAKYQRTVLQLLFKFDTIVFQLTQLTKTVDDHLGAFNAETKPWLETIQLKLQAIEETAKKFEPQLLQLQKLELLPEQNEPLQQRIKAAADYFSQQLQSIIQSLPLSPAVTDSKLFAQEYNEELKGLHAQLSQKLYAINSCKNGFNLDEYNEQKNQFKLIPLNVNAYAGSTSGYRNDSPHPMLYKQLRQLRDVICKEEGDAPIYYIASGNTIDEMARYLPQTLEELRQVSGFGKIKIDKYGDRFLNIIKAYCEQHHLSSLIHTKDPKRQRKEKVPGAVKPDTKEETYKLHKDGKTISQIAKERNLTASTIEGHLAYFVQLGILSVEELLSKEKIILIEPALKSFEGGSIIPVKEQLGESVTYGEIKLVLASRDFIKSKNGTGL